MDTIKQIIQKRKVIIFVMMITVFVIMLPNFQENLVIGDDYEFHLSRIKTISESLKNGEFPVKIHPLMAKNFGYAAGVFYPNMFLYIPATLCMLGMDIVLSFKMFLLTMFSLMFVLTYVSIKNITEETNSALIGTVLIILSKVICTNLYLRLAVGEFLGMIFLIPIISGMYDLVYKGFKKPWLLFIGFFGVMNSHIITTFIAIIFCAFYYLINFRKVSIKNVGKLLLIALLVVLATSSFWAPMLEQLSVQKYKLSNEWVHIESEVYTLYDLFSREKFSIGIVITLFMPVLLYALFDSRITVKTKKFIIMFFIITALTVSSWFWEITKDYLGVIQFKWRVLGLLTILSSIAITLAVKEYSQIKEIKLDNVLMFVLAISIFATIQFNISDFKAATRIRSAEDLEAIYYAEHAVGIGQEYLPVEIDYNKLLINEEGRLSNGRGVGVIKRNLHTEFQSEKDYEYVVIPSIYYYGYVGNLVNSEGEIINLDIEKSEDGLVKVITNGYEGKVSVWYNGTKVQKISYIISAMTIVLLVVYIIVKKIRNKSKVEK